MKMALIITVCFMIFFVVLFLIIITRKKTSHTNNQYADTNYIIKDEGQKYDESSITYHNNNSTNSKVTSVAQTIYMIFFCIVWYSALIFMMIMAFESGAPGYLILFFLPFLLAGILPLAKVITHFKKGKVNKQTTASNVSKPVENEYYVRLCSFCGAELRENDNFCPHCGKSIK